MGMPNMTARKIHTLWDGRRGYFYTSRMAGTPLFQEVKKGGSNTDSYPELADAEDHELQEEEDSNA